MIDDVDSDDDDDADDDYDGSVFSSKVYITTLCPDKTGPLKKLL